MTSIIWREWQDKPGDRFGHGVRFQAGEIGGKNKGLVAFLDGYDWLHGSPKEVVIYCIKPENGTSSEVLSEMKERIEQLVKSKTLTHGQIMPGLFAWFNA